MVLTESTHQIHFTTKDTEDTKERHKFLFSFSSFVFFVPSVVNPLVF